MDPNQNSFGYDMPPVNLSFQPNNGRKFAVSAFILSLFSIVFLLWGLVWLEFTCLIAAIVLAIISRKRSHKWNGLGLAGLIIAIAMLVITIALIAIGFYIAIQAIQNPDGEVAKLLDQYFLRATGKTFSEYINTISQ